MQFGSTPVNSATIGAALSAPNDANKFLNGVLGWATPTFTPSGSPVTSFNVTGATPSTFATVVTPVDNPYFTFIVGSYLYVVTEATNALLIYYIGPAGTLTLVSNTSTGASTTPSSVWVSGNLCIVGCYGNSRVKIYNIANKKSPALLSTITPAGSGPRTVTVQGRYLFFCNLGSTTNGLEVWDISDPTAPVSAAAATTGAGPFSLTVQGKYVFVTQQTAKRLEAFLVSDTAGVLSVASVGTVGLGNGVRYTVISGNYAYALNRDDNTISTIDVSDPTAMAVVGSPLAVGTQPIYAVIQDTILYVSYEGTSATTGFAAFSLATPSAPSLLWSLATTANTETEVFSVQGQYLYAAAHLGTALYVVSIGGVYAQQLEAGGIVTDTLDVKFGIKAMDLDLWGGLHVGRSVQIDNNLGVSGAGKVGGLLDLTSGATFAGDAVTKLYRSAASTLKTDGSFTTGAAMIAGTQVKVPAGDATTKGIRFDNDLGWYRSGGSVIFGSGATDAISMSTVGISILVDGAYLQGIEASTPPGAGGSNTYRLYCEDNGSGKTRLMVIFSSGAAQQLAIQP